MTWDRKTAPALAATMVMRIEQFRPHAYWDPIGKCWTYGVGFTRKLDGSAVRENDAITLPQALTYLTILLERYIPAICNAITVPMTETWAATLLDWCHNLGTGNLAGSMIAKMANAGNWVEAGHQLNGWCVGGGVVQLGLMRRREYERRIAQGEATEANAYTAVWVMSETALMPLYYQAFAEAKTWGWATTTPTTHPVVAQLHAGMATKPVPVASPAQSTETTEDLNDAQFAAITGEA